MGNRTHTTSIHILDDDSLLNLFYLYRPFLLGEDEDEDARVIGGNRQWAGERWWYQLSHVCQRWRNLILGSASYLGLSLVCLEGTPVANMLTHSPPLPLVIDYNVDEYRDITAEDEEGMIFALKQRDRVRRVRLRMPVAILQKLIMVIDEEYPILEYIVAMPQIEDYSPILTFPETLQAPHLRHLTMTGFTLPIGSRLLTAAVGLVTLCLIMVHPHTYFHPNTLLRWLSFMPQLETLMILFVFNNPNRDLEGQLTHTPIIAPVTLPNLRYFMFRGVSDDLEALVHWITTPRLEKLRVIFFHQFTFSVPHLLEFMNTTKNLSFDSAKFEFSERQVYMEVYPCGETETYVLSITVDCQHLDWQVSSMAQISNSLSPMFSAVENLALKHRVHSRSSEEHNEVDHTEWYKFFSSFSSVRTLCVDDGLVEELSRCLRLHNEEFLPELKELTYFRSRDNGDPFSSFIDACQNAGRPVTLVRRSPNPDPILSILGIE